MTETPPVPQVCRNHPDAPARWVCLKCGVLLCDPCVTVVKRGRFQARVCPLCRDKCQEIASAGPGGAASLARDLRQAILYPVRGDGAYILGIGTFVVAGANYVLTQAIGSFRGASLGGGAALAWAVFYGFVGACICGYLALYLISIIGRSGGAENEPPDWPEISTWEEALTGFFLTAGTVAFSLGPATAFQLWRGGAGDAALPYWLLAALGVAYCPMGLLAVAMHDDLNALNPVRVVRAVVKAGPVYLLSLPGAVVLYLLNREGWQPGLVPFLQGGASLYLLMLEGRILGLIYRWRSGRLNWFPDDEPSAGP